MKSKLQHFLLITGLCITAIPVAPPVKAALNNSILPQKTNVNSGQTAPQQLALTQSSFTNVTVKISRAVALDDIDENIGGRADFFAVVSIDNESRSTPGVDNNNDIRPNWQVSKLVNKGSTVPIKIQLWDYDSHNSNDQADISSNSGKTIELRYNTATGVITEPNGAIVGAKNYKLQSFGDEGGDRAGIVFSISHT
jgi:hypothetical protein